MSRGSEELREGTYDEIDRDRFRELVDEDCTGGFFVWLMFP